MNSKKSNKIVSRIFSISLRSVKREKYSLEVITSFTAYEEQVRTWKESTFYDMRQVSPEELLELRFSRVPGIVYKRYNTLFYAPVPDTLAINGRDGDLGKHKCGCGCAKVCEGCLRTKDLTVEYQLKQGKTFREAVKKSWRIEKYDFIREGLETFNMNTANDAFIVLACENYTSRKVVF